MRDRDDVRAGRRGRTQPVTGVLDRGGCAGRTPSRPATVRYTSGAGLPCATSSVDTVASNSGAIPAAVSTVSIRAGGEELASPSGQRSAIRRTASTAPGISGRWRA